MFFRNLTIAIFALYTTTLVFAADSTEHYNGYATFATNFGPKSVAFRGKIFPPKNAPLFFAKVQQQLPKLTEKNHVLYIDMQEFGLADAEIIEHIFEFLAGRPLNLSNHIKTTLLIRHANDFELPALGEAIIARLATIKVMLESAEDNRPFSQIARAICNVAFNENGNYKGDDHWTGHLLLSFQLDMDEGNARNFQAILSKKKEEMASVRAANAASQTGEAVTIQKAEEQK